MLPAALPADDETARLALLRSLGAPDGESDATLQPVLRAAVAAVGTPIAYICLIDAEQQVFAAAIGLQPRPWPREASLCQHTIRGDDLLVVEDALQHPNFADHPLVRGPAQLRFYAGMPMRVDGLALGTLAVLDRVPRTLSAAQCESLRALAALAAQGLLQRRAARTLARNEARFRDFAALAVDWLWESDTEGRLTWLHAPHDVAAEASTGWALGQPLPAGLCVRPDGTPLESAQPFAALLAHEQRVPPTFTRHVDGSRVLLLAAQPVHDEAGTLLGWRGQARDLTEGLRLHREIQDLRLEKQAAQMAGAAQQRFLARASHELRNPLHALLGFAELVRAAPQLADEQRQQLDHMQQAGRRLKALVDDMLDVSRAGEGGPDLRLRDVDVADAVDQALSMVLPEAQRLRLRIRIDAGDGPRRHARCDARALDEVLLNLLSNAVKYNRPGGRLDVRIAGNDDRVEIAVRDQGAGLSAAQQRQLFQPFNRLGAEHSAVPGTGLGLVIAKGLAARMGGRIDVRSTPQRGSCFTLTLPAAAPGAEMPPPTQPAALAPLPPPPAPLPASDAPKRVLYVEDDPVNVVLMQQLFLRRPAWTLVHAPDAPSGLAAALAQAPDLVLTDINLPGVSGGMLLQKLRAEAPLAHVPFIAVSGDALPHQIAAALAAGFADYWTKPLDLAATLTRLDRWLAPPSTAAAAPSTTRRRRQAAAPAITPP